LARHSLYFIEMCMIWIQCVSCCDAIALEKVISQSLFRIWAATRNPKCVKPIGFASELNVANITAPWLCWLDVLDTPTRFCRVLCLLLNI
jgi:hypothetical protein